MFTQENSGILRILFCTVAALAVSTTMLLAATGPAQAQGAVSLSQVKFIPVSTGSPIVY